ncbi:DNA-binding anti-repressor SinI [Aquibacillus halophilus]|uniref:DNA-binding anti-repressor SinI n=1 Tax=Aquibacillus halophilus TaxID=930132 RepID=A0A6A8DBY2_9BACI|nr:anti-repressor SinI family protein [Aquibacillus halophilus]MRH41281.1 DNA-binding anti-repressor SinI [Aquibacillus halophilus]
MEKVEELSTESHEKEWLALMVEARGIGITKDEVEQYLKDNNPIK